MYKIIGADQREYGPVAADQIRKWIAEGRADRQTRIMSDDGAGWKRLDELSEFAEAMAAKYPPMQTPPLVTSPAIGGSMPAPCPIGCDPVFRISECFRQAWALYQANFWLLLGATAVMLVITAGLGSIHGVGWLAHALLCFAFWGGLDFLFLKLIRGQSGDIGEAFTGFKSGFVALILASLVAHVLTAIGFVFLILPGIYLLTAWWMFTPLLVIDKSLDFWPAMELSRKTVNRHWWPCFGLFVLACLVTFAGLLLCGIGVFFTLPLALGAIVYAYQELFDSPVAASQSAPVAEATKSAGVELPRSDAPPPPTAPSGPAPPPEPTSAAEPSSTEPPPPSA